MSKNKPTPKYPGEDVFVEEALSHGEVAGGGQGYRDPKVVEELSRELWSEMTKAERYRWLAQHEAYRILKDFPHLPKHSLNEPSDCLASKVKDFLEEKYGIEYSKKHIAERFLNDLIRPPK